MVKSRRTTGLRTPVLAISGIHPLGRLQHQPLDLDQSPNASGEANVAKLAELVRKGATVASVKLR